MPERAEFVNRAAARDPCGSAWTHDIKLKIFEREREGERERERERGRKGNVVN